jgi:hypothetical protein
MAFSNTDLTRELNLVLKALQDIVTSTRITAANGSNITMKDLIDTFSKASNNVGSDSKRMAQMLDKLVKRMDGVGIDTAKTTLALKEIAKDGSIDIGKIERLLSPDQFSKLFELILKKVKDSPVSLNTKENLSMMSKAIAKGNRDYASSGLGKVEADFYRNASNKQINELSKIRNELSSQKKSSALLDIAKGLTIGTAAQISDVIMSNAGFGELPAKFANVFVQAKNLWGLLKDKKNQSASDRNAMLLEAYKASEASYAEQRRKNEEGKNALINGEASNESMKQDLAFALNDVLNKTSFGDTKKENYKEKLNSGNFGTREINNIINDWKKTLGSSITQEDLDMMHGFYGSMQDGIATIKETDELLSESRKKYVEGIDHENEAMVNATSLKEQVDELMLKELEAKKKEIEKSIKKNGKHLSDSMKKALADDQLLKATKELKEKWGVADSESKGLFNDNTERTRSNLLDMGMNEKEAQHAIETDDGLSKSLGYNNKLNSKLAAISPIFNNSDVVSKTERRPIPKAKRFRMSSITSEPEIIKYEKNEPNNLSPKIVTAPTKPMVNPEEPGTPPGDIIEASNKEQPSGTKSLEPKSVKRSSGLAPMENNSEYIKKHYDLMMNIYGKDGSKFADMLSEKIANRVMQVKITNLPTGESSSNDENRSTTPP